jgi:hypothetical protein
MEYLIISMISFSVYLNGLPFPSLSSCVITVILGNLDLRDISTVGNGKLEIVNRVYGYEPSAGIDATSSLGTALGMKITNDGNRAGGCGVAVTSVTCTAGGAVDDLVNASSTRVGINIFDNTAFAGKNGALDVANATVFCTRSFDTDTNIDKLYFNKGASRSAAVLSVTPYNQTQDSSIATGDLCPKTEGGIGDELEGFTTSYAPRKIIEASDQGSVVAYGNYFREVVLNNCHGDIKLTNLCVDGASGVDTTSQGCRHNTLHGFNINSSDIFLENCASVRNRLSGFYLANSNVNILGNFIGYRNYPKNSGSSTRGSGEYGAGLRGVNSNVVFADTSYLGYGEFSAFNKFQVAFAKNDYGMHLRSSEITGGTRLLTGSVVPNAGNGDQTTSILATFQNTRSGIFVQQSDISYLGRIDSFNNLIGVEAKNSTWNAPQLTCEDNQIVGVDLESSELVYGYRMNEHAGDTLPDSSTGLKRVAYSCTNNGINVRAHKGSSIKPYNAIDHTQQAVTGSSELLYTTYIGMWGGRRIDLALAGTTSTTSMAMVSHGSVVQDAQIHDLPCILVTNNSDAEIHNLAAAREATKSKGKGTIVLCDRESHAHIRGSSTSPTDAGLTLAGSTFTSREIYNSFANAAFTASRSSSVMFTGPTKIYRFGVAALAEDNSTVELTTPKAANGASPATIPYGLSSNLNQSIMQIHATRSCLVANRNSNLVMSELGGSPQLNIGSSVDYKFNRFNLPGDYANSTSAMWQNCTSAASLWFYPQGFSPGACSGAQAAALDGTKFNRARATTLLPLLASADMGKLTTGGMVARAVGGSNVSIVDTNFGFTAPASSVSGSVYNWNGNSTGTEWDGHEPGGDVGGGGGGDGTWIGPSGDGGLYDSASWPPWNNLGPGNPSGYQMAYDPADDCDFPGPGTSAYDTALYGTRIHIWNISDTSRISARNINLHNVDPSAYCQSNNYHGPPGKWRNGAALDYFGEYGVATTYAGTGSAWQNRGVFRLMLGHRGDVKTFYGVSANSKLGENKSFGFGYGNTGETTDGSRGASGLFIDQLNAQGYQCWTPHAGYMSQTGDGNIRRNIGAEGGLQGAMVVSGFENIFGMGSMAASAGIPSYIQFGMAAVPARNYNFPQALQGADLPWGVFADTSGAGLFTWEQAAPAMPIPALHMDWQGYMRNWLDDSASNTFANSKHMAGKKVNGVSIYRSHTGLGGEGRDDEKMAASFGPGVRSLNVFDLDSLL